MKYFVFAAVVALSAWFGGTLSAQAQDIDVQVPVGTSVTNGAKVKDGKSSNGDIINYTVRIANAGGTNLALTAPVVQGGSYKSVQVNMTNVPVAQSLAPAAFVEFNVEIDPDKDSDWSFVITITSDDPVDGTFTVKFEGTQGSPEEDEDCSTGENNSSMLMLLGLLCAMTVALRLRSSKA